MSYVTPHTYKGFQSIAPTLQGYTGAAWSINRWRRQRQGWVSPKSSFPSIITLLGRSPHCLPAALLCLGARKSLTLFPLLPSPMFSQSFLPGVSQLLRSPKRECDIPVKMKIWAHCNRGWKVIWRSYTTESRAVIGRQHIYFKTIKTQSPGIPTSQRDEKESFSAKACYISKKACGCFPRT